MSEAEIKEARIKYLSELLIIQFYDGVRTGDSPNRFRCYTPEEIEEMKREWPRYREMAEFALRAMGVYV